MNLAVLVVIFVTGSTSSDVMLAESCHHIEEAVRSGSMISIQTLEMGWVRVARVRCLSLDEFIGVEVTQ